MIVEAFKEEPFEFSRDEGALVPGGPARPSLIPMPVRLAYGATGLFLAMTAQLSSALVSVNGPHLLGALGVSSQEYAWLPVAYAMTYVSSNLLLVRFRQQFGLRLYAMLALTLTSGLALLQTFIPGPESGSLGWAIAVRAALGLAAAPLPTMAAYYLVYAVKPKFATSALVLALGLLSSATPLARMVSPRLLDLGQWYALSTFELGVVMIALGLVALVRLPPSEKTPVFEPLDIVSYGLLASGIALVCAVIGLGVQVWWFDRPSLGWALAASVPLLGAGVLIELNRDRPLLDVRWLETRDFVRFVAVSLIARLVLAEQGSAIGLLSTLGQDADQLVDFNALVALGTVAGAVAAAFLFRPERIGGLVALAIAAMAGATFIDAHSTALTRADRLVGTQVVIACCGALFLGPALVFGIARVLKSGGDKLITFVVLFAVTQNLGGLAGTALLGTYQIVREETNLAVLGEGIPAFDPLLAARVAENARSAGGAVAEHLAGAALLQSEAGQQASVLAYDNTFLLVSVVATGTALYLVVLLLHDWMRRDGRRRLPIRRTSDEQ